jgi:hypothetical protein
MLTVLDHGHPVGFLLRRGISGVEAFTLSETSIGTFETTHRAATALRQLAHMGSQDGD